MQLAACVVAQDERIDKLAASVDALAAALHTNTKMLARIGAIERRQSSATNLKGRASRAHVNGADAEAELAPLSNVDKSRPERMRTVAPAEEATVDVAPPLDNGTACIGNVHARPATALENGRGGGALDDEPLFA